jgi:PAS domain S-box-containing protein
MDAERPEEQMIDERMKKSSAAVYAVSLAAVAVAVAVRLLLEPLLSDHFPLATFFLAVGFAAWYGGRGPGLLALVAGAFAVDFFVFPPRYTFAIAQFEHQVGLVLYGVVGFASIAMFESLRNAQRQAEKQRREWEQEVAARRVAERAFAEQAERLRTTLASIGDAVITTDMEARIANMNAVAESLTGWTAADAMGHRLDAVFRIVNESSREAVENPALRALREGVIVGLANHTILIAKDGAERPIDDSAAPIRCKDGEVVGCVLVFRDMSERHRQNAELEKRERQFRTLAESIPQLAWMANADGHIVWYNRRWYDYTGTTLEQMAGWGWQSVHDPEELPKVLEQWKTSLAAGTPLEMTFPLKGRDGRFRPFLTRVEPVKDDEGRVVQWFGTNTDIAEQKRAEQALRDSEQRMRLAMETTKVGIWEWNLITGEVRWDAMMFQIYGITPTPNGVVQYRDWSEAVLPEDLPRQEAVLQDTIERLGSSSRQFRIKRRNDGKLREIECKETVRTNDKGHAEWVVGTNLDVTERKRQEKEIADNSRTLDAVIERCPFGIYIVDADFRIASLNLGSQAGAFANVRPVIGRAFDEAMRIIWPEPVAAGVIGAFRHTLETGEPYSSKDFMNPRADIEQTEGYEWELHRIRMPDGRPGVVCYYFDSTQLRRAEQQLKDADRRKDEFLATLAHELRNPLAPIRHGLQLMKLADGQAAIIEQARSMMERQLTQLVRLVDDLMDVSRISRGKLELRKERVPLAAVLNSALETSRPLIEQMGHELTVTLPKQPLIVDADVTRLAQVFLNLLNNAAKYGNRRGRIHLNVERQGSDVVVTVKDTGIGIAADQLLRIFEMFTQVDRSLEKSQGGLGIGLTLVKRLVDLHGGSVEAKSDGPGKGSEFVVRLPVVIEALQAQESSSDEEPMAPKSALRILIVEDNRDGAESLEMMLRILGDDIRTAYDGQQGVNMAKDFRPDVILLDIGLPKLNGYDACRRIREQPWGKNIVLIAVTGWGQDEDRRRSDEAGFDHHMVKPLDPKALMKTLAGLRSAPA